MVKREKETKLGRYMALACGILGIGIFMGACLRMLQGTTVLHRLLDITVLSKGESLGSLFLHYASFGAILWGLGFVSVGIPFLYAALVWKGMAYGYIITGLISVDLSAGLFTVITTYLPQSFFLLPAYCLLAAAAQSMILEQFRIRPPRGRLKREQERRFTEYLLIFLIAMAAIFVASVITAKIG